MDNYSSLDNGMHHRSGGPCQSIRPRRPNNTCSARNITLGMGRPGSLYAVTLWVKNPAQVQGNDSVHVTVNDAKGEVESNGCMRLTWIYT